MHVKLVGLFVIFVAIWVNKSTAICVALEHTIWNNKLKCVECENKANSLRGPVVWLKNDMSYTPDPPRVQTEGTSLVFTEFLPSDEASWTCTSETGFVSPPYLLYAERAIVLRESSSLNYTIGESFAVPLNIEVGVNTVRGSYTVRIDQHTYYHNRTSHRTGGGYYNNNDANGLQWASVDNDSSYSFDSRNLSLLVDNFSIPNPGLVRGVKYIFTFIVGSSSSVKTRTVVIPGFRPPAIVRRLSNFTLVSRGSSYNFSVEVDSHPSPKSDWTVNGKTVTNNMANFIMAEPTRVGNVSTFTLTILNISDKHLGHLKFNVKLANSRNSTQTDLITSPRLQSLQITNGCSDLTHGEGPLNFALTLPENFTAFRDHQFRSNLQAHLELNWSQLPEYPGEEIAYTTITSVNVTESLQDLWRRGRTVDHRVDLAVDRASAVPGHVISHVREETGSRFRVQARLSFNGSTALEWSPACHSAIVQPCMSRSSALIKLRLEFKEGDLQCSRYTTTAVMREIQKLIRKLFQCDNITVSSAEEYHCDQKSRVSTFRAKLFSYRAEDRVKQLYAFLKTGNVSFFNGTTPVTKYDDAEVSLPHYVYILLATVCAIVMIVVVVSTAVLIGRRRKKSIIKPEDSHSVEEKGGRGQPRDKSTSHDQCAQPSRVASSTSDASVSSISPSSIFTRYSQPPGSDGHTSCLSPHLTTPSQTHHHPQQLNGDFPMNVQDMELEDQRHYNIPGIPLQSCDPRTRLSRNSHSPLHIRNETSISLSELDSMSTRYHPSIASRAESSALSDELSLDEFEPRQRCRNTQSPDMRATPSSGYQSQCSSVWSRQQPYKRSRHDTDSSAPPPSLSGLSLVHLPQVGYFLLPQQGTHSPSQLQQVVHQMAPSDLIQVHPSSSRLQSGDCDECEERTVSHGQTRSHEHLHPSVREDHRFKTELRTVVPNELLSPHHHLSDHSRLEGSPGEGERYHRQDTQTSSEADTSIL